MKKKTDLISFGTAFTILLLTSCTAQKQNDKNEEVKTHERTEETLTQSKTIIQPYEAVDKKVKIQINGFLADYFELNKALINDNLKGARDAAGKLAGSVKKFDMKGLTGDQMDFYYIQVSKLSSGLQGIDESTDIEKTRAALSEVSESMYTLVKAFHPHEASLYYQFCPMAKNGAGANWLSSTKEIVNPYMGQMMPECGRTEEIIP